MSPTGLQYLASKCYNRIVGRTATSVPLQSLPGKRDPLLHAAKPHGECTAALEKTLARERLAGLTLGGGFDSLGLISQRLAGAKQDALDFYENNSVGRFFDNLTGAGSGAPVAEAITTKLKYANTALGWGEDSWLAQYVTPLFEGGSFAEISQDPQLQEIFQRKGNLIVSAGTLYKILVNVVIAKQYRRIAHMAAEAKDKQTLNGNCLRGASYAFEKSGLFLAGITYNYMDGSFIDGTIDNVTLACLCMGANHIGKLIGGAAVVYGNTRFILENLHHCEQLGQVKEMAYNFVITLSKAIKSAYTLGYFALLGLGGMTGSGKDVYGVLTQSTFDMPSWMTLVLQGSLALPHAAGLFMDAGYLLTGKDIAHRIKSFFVSPRDGALAEDCAPDQHVDRVYHGLGAATSIAGIAGAYYMASLISDPVGWEFVAIGSALFAVQTAYKHQKTRHAEQSV